MSILGLTDLTFDIVADRRVAIPGLLLGLFLKFGQTTFGTCSIWFIH